MPLSGPLSSWLLTERSDAVAVDTIRRSPILRDEARDAMPALREAALTTATEAQIRAIIGQRFALFQQPERTDGEWAAWWSAYFEALSDLTPFAVEAGMAAWVKRPEAEFMCKPGKLRELAMTVPNDNRWAKAHSRAERATFVEPVYSPPPPVDKSDRPTAEEVQAEMAAFHAKMADKDPFAKLRAKAKRPTPSARVDNTGISAEMRTLLQQRYAER